MGIFSGILQKRDPIEARLETEYTAAYQLMGQSKSEAVKMAREFVASAKAEVVKSGTANQRPNMGDYLLQQEAHDPKIKAALEALRVEGVRDSDIKDWWNMTPLERMALEKSDELNRVSCFIGLLKQGMNDKEAGKKVWQLHPKYGKPADSEGVDRPLPIELKGRVLLFLEKHQRHNPAAWGKRLEQSTSLNAIIRDAMKGGWL